MRLLKCYGYCEGVYPKEQLIKYSNKNHCYFCADRKRQEKIDRDLLYKTIQTIYKIPYPTGMMLKQISQYKEDRNYTYEGMTKTLCYFVKVQGKTPVKQAGLALVPYHYETAVDYYEKMEERRKNSADVSSIIKTVKVTIKPPRATNTEVKNRKIIDMGALKNNE